MMSGYDFNPYVHSIARRQPRRLPACTLFSRHKTGINWDFNSVQFSYVSLYTSLRCTVVAYYAAVLIGRITGLARQSVVVWNQNASALQLSVCPSVRCGIIIYKTKRRSTNPKFVLTFPRTGVTGAPFFSSGGRPHDMSSQGRHIHLFTLRSCNLRSVTGLMLSTDSSPVNCIYTEWI